MVRRSSKFVCWWSFSNSLEQPCTCGWELMSHSVAHGSIGSIGLLQETHDAPSLIEFWICPQALAMWYTPDSVAYFQCWSWPRLHCGALLLDSTKILNQLCYAITLLWSWNNSAMVLNSSAMLQLYSILLWSWNTELIDKVVYNFNANC